MLPKRGLHGLAYARPPSADHTRLARPQARGGLEGPLTTKPLALVTEVNPCGTTHTESIADKRLNAIRYEPLRRAPTLTQLLL